jgi:dihydroflavonol-4-reductase
LKQVRTARPERALVTGATGLVGGHIVRTLVAAGHPVRVLVRPGADLRGLHGLAVDAVEGDVLEPGSLIPAARGCALVFHAAAVFAYSGMNAQAQTELAVNGTRNVIAAANTAGARRVVVTSSSVVLGSTSTPQVLDESTPVAEPHPSAYTRSKIAQDAAALAAGGACGQDVVCVCPTLVIGAFDYRLSPSNANIVNYLNDPFRSTFLGGCNLVCAEDVGVAHLIAATHGEAGARYIAGSENLTWPQVHELISRLTGTFGPSLRLNHTAAYLAAAAAEMSARLTGTRAAVTRDEALMSARYYWYSHERLGALGYSPRPGSAVLVPAIAWLLLRSYVSDSVQGQLQLAAEVVRARNALRKQMRP